MAYNAIFLHSALIHVVQVYGTLNKLATLEVTSVQPGIKKVDSWKPQTNRQYSRDEEYRRERFSKCNV